MRVLAAEDRVDLDDLLLPLERLEVVGDADQPAVGIGGGEIAWIGGEETERIVSFINEQGIPMLALEGISQSSEDTTESEVDTGDPLPSWANAVIPIENAEPMGENGTPSSNPRRPAAIRIRSAVAPWTHVRSMGEDLVATQLILPAGHTLRPVDLGAAAAGGHDRVKVSRKPRVAILPTGTELVSVGQPVKPG